MSQVQASTHVRRVSCKHLPKPLGGSCKIPFVQQGGSESVQGARMPGRVSEGARKCNFGIARGRELNIDPAEFSPKFRVRGRKFKAALECFCRFLKLVPGAEQDAEFVERTG